MIRKFENSNLLDESVLVKCRVQVNETQKVTDGCDHAFADMVSNTVSLQSWAHSCEKLNMSMNQDIAVFGPASWSKTILTAPIIELQRWTCFAGYSKGKNNNYMR